MRRTIAVAVCAVTLSMPPLTAQVGSMRVTVPSPTAASLGKFGDVPVAYYTGVPSISIPLFTAKGKTLELPIALTYHAGGIRVEEIGGWVGIGWALEAGGSITRTVHGIVDEDLHGYFNTGQTWYGPEFTNPSSTAMNNVNQEQLDSDPDQFFFSFAGHSGQIVAGPVSTTQGVLEYHTIPHLPWRIEVTNSAYAITAWVITTEDGTKYTFDAVETNTDWSLPTTGQFPAHWGHSFNSAWHLTSIEAPGGDVIAFGYTPYTVRHRLSPYFEKNDLFTGSWGSPCRPDEYGTINDYQVDAMRLASITTAAHTITFSVDVRADAMSPANFNGGSSQPQVQEPLLVSMTVAAVGGPPLRIFTFEHDYSTGRLTLTNVYERDKDGVSLPPYSFTYSLPSLPALTSYSQDFWGFYNGKSNPYTPVPQGISPDGIVLAGADRNPDPAFTIAGALTKITYPTGGYNEFFYEPNDYGGIGLSAVLPLDGDPQTRHVETWGISSASFTIFGANPNDHVPVTVNMTQDPSGCNVQIYPPCPYTNIVDQSTQQNVIGWTDSGIHDFTLLPGTYTFQTTDNGGYPTAWATADLTWRDHIPAPKKRASGLRIAEIRTTEPTSTTVTVRKYKYTLQSDPTRSSGMVNAEPNFSYQWTSPECSFFSRSSMSKVPLGSGPVVGYREVEVWLGTNGEFGKTRHTFRSVADIADQLPVELTWPSMRTTTYEFQRGLETGTSEYNATAQVQQQHTSSYAFPTVRGFHGMSVYFMDAGLGGQYYVLAFALPYNVWSSWVQQTSETTTAYDESGGNPVVSSRTYAYGNPVHGQVTEITETNSDGTQRITRMKYPDDYGSGSGDTEAAALTAMRGTAHMPGIVIERSVRVRVGASDNVVQAEITSFKDFGGGHILPFKHYVFNSPTPLP